MMLSVKHDIAVKFGRAAKSYDQFSRLQRHSGQQLLQALPEVQFLNGLDLGCGSGYFLPHLAERCDQLVGVDLSCAMLNMSATRQTKARLLQGDAEALPLKDDSFDLIFSNLALQWCPKLRQALSQCWHVLKPGGVMVWTTLADGTLNELQQSFSCIDEHLHIRSFQTQEQIVQQAADAGIWQQSEIVSRPLQLQFATLRELLHELKGFGANHLSERRKGLMTPSQLRQVEHFYRSHFSGADGGLAATYQVIYGVFKK